MSNNNSHFVKKILERYKDIHGLGSWEDVAERIGVTPSTLSGWKSRNTQKNISDIIKTCDSDVNLNWLFTGEGQKRINQEVSAVHEEFLRYEASLNDADTSDISQDEIIEFLLSQQEIVLDFLRNLKKK